MIKLALNNFTDLFDTLPPYRQKGLLRLTAYKILLSEKKIKIALYGRPPEKGLFNISETGIRSQTVRWLPGLMSESVLLWDKVRIQIQRIKHGKLRIVYSNSDM